MDNCEIADNCGIVNNCEIANIVKLQTLQILDLKIHKCLQYFNLQLICNSELQVSSLLTIHKNCNYIAIT